MELILTGDLVDLYDSLQFSYHFSVLGYGIVPNKACLLPVNLIDDESIQLINNQFKIRNLIEVYCSVTHMMPTISK